SYSLEAEQLHFRRLSVRDGLPSAYINAISQHQDGFIWLGTKGGLARFDGLRFVHFQLSERTGLGSNDILALLQDQQQRFWVGTERGLYIFDDTRAHFALQALPIPDATVLTLFQDEQLQIWVGTDAGLFWFNEAEARFEQILPDAEVKFLIEQGDLLWIGTKQGLFVRQQGMVDAVDLTASADFDVRHQRLFDGVLLGEQLYLATQRDGLLMMNTRSRRLEQQWLTEDGLASNSIWALALQKDELWLGYFYDGIGVMSLPEHGLRHFSHHPQIQYSMPYNNISQLLFDQSGQLWVATTNGLGVANPLDAAIVHLGEYQNISNKHVWSVAMEGETLWFGTESGLNHFDFRDQQLTTFLPSYEPGGLPHTVIWSLLPWQEQVWLGTNAGLLLFDPEREQAEVVIAGREVYSLRRHQQQLHIGFYDGGFAVMRLADTGIELEYQLPVSAYITDSLPQQDGFLLGTSNGLWQWQDEAGVARQLAIPSLQDRHITSLLLAQELLWVATQDHGLFVLQQQGQQWQLRHHLKTADGLPEDQLRALARADNGSIWLSGMRSLSQIVPDTLSVTPFSRYLHWVDMEFHANAASRSTSTRLAFAGNQGILIFAPEQLTARVDFPLLHLTSVQLMADSHPAFIDYLRIEPEQSYYAFEFAALEYLSPERIQYQYRLLPLMESWRAMAGNQLSLSQLAPGQYELQVRASNADGLWGPDIKRIQLDVIPPWWLSWPAKLSYLLLTVLLLSYGILTQWHRHRKLSYIANHDNLTKLANRRYFNAELAQRLLQAKRQQHALALLYFDLNNFKTLNDTLGHDAGDQLLVETAIKLKQASRATDFAARLGGDEFVLILDRIKNEEELHKALERLSSTLNSPGKHYAAQALDVSCSIGVAVFNPAAPVSADVLVKQADTAMYRSKAGQHPWCLYQQGNNQ
ncbi:MAG: diguanylate cyclase, partial [Alkalimonas sp.]|nr:diguanylate cyclase [Alkalimonas sp.]